MHVRVALELVEVVLVTKPGVVGRPELHGHGQEGDHEQPSTEAGGDPRLPGQRHASSFSARVCYC